MGDTEPPRPYLLQFASKMLPTATRMSFFKNLFKEAGVKDVITLFHAPSVPASMRAHAILKQAAATAQSSATEDQHPGLPWPIKSWDCRGRSNWNQRCAEEVQCEAAGFPEAGDRGLEQRESSRWR